MVEEVAPGTVVVVVVVGTGIAPTVMVIVPSALAGEPATGDCHSTRPSRRSPGWRVCVRTVTPRSASEATRRADADVKPTTTGTCVEPGAAATTTDTG